MKISTNQILMAVMVAAGIFAVAVAHRATDSGLPQSFESGPLSFQSLDQLAGKNLVGLPHDASDLRHSIPDDAAAEFGTSIGCELDGPQARLAQIPNAQVDDSQVDDSQPAIPPVGDSLSFQPNEARSESMSLTLDEPSQRLPLSPQPRLAPPSQPDDQASAASFGVQSFNLQLDAPAVKTESIETEAVKTESVKTESIRIAALPTAAPSSPALATVTARDSSAENPLGNRSKQWRSNPFIGNQSPNSGSASGSSVQPRKPAETDSLHLPSLDFSSSSIAPDRAPIDSLTANASSSESSDTSSNAKTDIAVASATAAEFASTSVASIPAFDRSQAVVTGMSEAAAQKAVHHIEYGKSLARRNASQAATQEFYSALRVLAQANDSQVKSDTYTQSLRKGILAIKEAQDFMFSDMHSQIGMDVSYVAEGHETQLFGSTTARQLTATEAAQRYLEFAGQQLGRCGGQNVIAAEALYCLGKLHSIAAKADPNPESIEMAQSIVFHRAAIASNPQNFRSANELGVLLARNGETGEAEEFFKRSLMTSPTAQAWGNLAKVHQRRGTAQDMDLAQKAYGEYQLALTQEAVGSPSSTIQWMDPQQFVARSPNEYPESNFATQQAAAAVNPVVPASSREPVQAEGERTSFVDKINSFLPEPLRR